jgi:hypothetical protein
MTTSHVRMFAGRAGTRLEVIVSDRAAPDSLQKPARNAIAACSGVQPMC